MTRAARILIVCCLLLLPAATAIVLRNAQQPNLHLKWQIDANSPDIALRADGGIYVASTNKLAAFSNDGKELWSQVVDFDKGAQRDFLQSDFKGNAYLLLNKELTTFSSAGETLWTYEFIRPSGAMSVFTVKPDGVYLIVDGTVSSLDVKGNEQWQYKDVALVMHPPLVDHLGNLYYQPFYDVSPPGHIGPPIILRKAVCLTVTGQIAWEKTDVGLEAIFKDRLFISTSKGLECCNLQGDIIWANPQLTRTYSVTPDKDGVTYAVCGASQNNRIRVCAVDQQGHIVWDNECTIDYVEFASARGKPAVVGRTLYVGAGGLPRSPSPGLLSYLKLLISSSVPNVNGQVLAIDVGSGKLKWSFDAEDIVESKILGDPRTGTFYLPSWYEHVYALHAD